MVGDESDDEGIEEGEGGKGIMEGSILEGGACTMESPKSGVISEKDAFLDGIPIVKAGAESNLESLLYETIENLLDGNSEVSQSVSFDTMEERREESGVEGAGGFHWVEGESERDSFSSSLYWASSSTVLD